LAGAQRELLEETGHVARAWRELAGYSLAAAYGFAYHHFFMPEGLSVDLRLAQVARDLGEIVFPRSARVHAALSAASFLQLTTRSIGVLLPRLA